MADIAAQYNLTLHAFADDNQRRVWLPDVCCSVSRSLRFSSRFRLLFWLCLIPSFASWRREHNGVSCFADFGRFFEFLLD